MQRSPSFHRAKIAASWHYQQVSCPFVDGFVLKNLGGQLDKGGIHITNRRSLMSVTRSNPGSARSNEPGHTCISHKDYSLLGSGYEVGERIDEKTT